MNQVIISSSFDDLRSVDMRFLEEASRFGKVNLLLWTDEAVEEITGKPPKFPYQERLYFTRSIRYVGSIRRAEAGYSADELPPLDFAPDVWVVPEKDDTAAKRAFAEANGIAYRVITANETTGFSIPSAQAPTGRKKVVVTGCYDWFHTGHVAFFEEVSALGDLYVVVGNDANLRLLKGEGHPLFPEDERCFQAGSIRYVTQSLISSGSGWMDAEPEIVNIIKADIYAVNEDGDKPEKREFCEKHGLEYVVLKRIPKEGLKRRSSTDLRGF